MAKGKYQAKRRKRRLNPVFFVFLLIILLLVGGAAFLIRQGIAPNAPAQTGPSAYETAGQPFTDTGAPTPPPTTQPQATEPFITATASIGVTGDIMGHMPVINAGKTATGYDYAEVYQYIKPYYERYDVMIANLEVNLGGPEAGRCGHGSHRQQPQL